MKLGLISAILPEMAFEEVVDFLAASSIPGVEPMCWPVGSGDKRKFAGVTHIDAANLGGDAVPGILRKLSSAGVSITGLGYYPNPLTPDANESKVVTAHLREVILAAEKLGVPVVNTFVGRDWHLTLADNWKRFREVWRPLVQFATDHGVAIAIENCPMRFTRDEWPGGKNLASSPAIWRQMFQEIDSPNFGLNFDPSHLVLQYIDVARAVEEFGDRILHVHAKDLQVDAERLYEVGVMADNPKDWHTPKIPGRGQVPWRPFFQALRKVGYDGWVTIEIEEPSFKTLQERQQAVLLSRDFLLPLLAET
ncbi:MAG: sugar phosphate isomerase/epimerase [Acidobacteriales bacterium]|nr:MAG: sugar phosphate isomerase/epimerase [Terriglobales bacterium]